MIANGAIVRVADRPAVGHVRVPRYVRGKSGQVVAYIGSFLNPERLAFGDSAGSAIKVYGVQFLQSEIWPDYTGQAHDTAFIELPEHWLRQESQR